jgi:eukaryotic-like serine/threonine-protein kinase
MECLDEETVLALLEGQLGDARLGDVDRHIDGCTPCRRLVSSLAEETPGAAHCEADPLGPGVGAVLGGRFELEAIAGTGGMARIYRSRDRTDGTTVAIKRVDVDEARFGKEVRLLSDLSHPAIVRYIADGTCDDGTRYLAMQWLEGEDLARRLKRGRLGVDETRRLGARVADALGYAHARGVVHRDVKPSNLFLVHGDVDMVMLVDFGVARAPLEEATRTRTGALLGTPGYMAPEQARGEGHAGPQADVFSLGCVLYECLTGSRAFPGGNVIAVLSNLLTAKPPRARTLAPDVPRELDALLGRMLARDPSKRPANGAEVARELTSLDARRRASGQRRALAVGVAATALCALAGAVHVRSRRPATTTTTAAPVADRAARAITDFPAPDGTPHEAASAYADGLRALRAGKLALAKTHLSRAVDEDPTLGAAHLRLSIWTDATLGAEESRRHFQLAHALAATLSLRDRGLLEAMEPEILREPPDEAERTRRLRALSTRFPADAELALLAAGIGSGRATSTVDYDRVLALDPAYAQAWAERARAQMATDLPAARASLDACLDASPTSTLCLLVRTRIDGQTGDCVAMEADARAVIAAENGSEYGYGRLASALYSNGADREAVHEAVRQRVALVGPATQKRVLAASEAQWAAGHGDFLAAEASARELARLVDDAGIAQAHVAPTVFLVSLLEERGEVARAGAVAEAYLRRLGGWRSLATRPADDPRPFLVAAAARAGLRPKGEVRRVRDAWADEWRGRLGDAAAGDLWLEGWARPARDVADAREALAALPAGLAPEKLVPSPGWVTPLPFALTDAAHTQLLAGDPRGAAATLEKVTGNCSALNDTLGHTRAHYLLGRAREAAGDAAAACTAYRVVLARWGAARPRSVTAELALQRLHALACASP